MTLISRGRTIVAALACGLALACPADAFLFWTRPAMAGGPATGDEPGIAVALPGATAKEKQANLVWTLRAGLNVAALQCQFAPVLMTVANYNGLLRQHGSELQSNYDVLTAYFKRVGGKTWQTQLDQYTTRTYNSFSTMYAQMTFCDTAAAIGRDALTRPRGEVGALAVARMREFRASLTPAGDQAFAFNTGGLPDMAPTDLMAPPACVDKKGRPKKSC